MSGGSTLVNYLKEFTNAHVITGHTHINYTIEPSDQLIEHNIAAVCHCAWAIANESCRVCAYPHGTTSDKSIAEKISLMCFISL